MVIKPWIRIGIQAKMLDLDPDPDEMNADPQPCLVGGGQPRQQADQRVLNVRVLAQLRVLCNAEHALADSFEFFLGRGQKKINYNTT